MAVKAYKSMDSRFNVNRRDFLKISGGTGLGLMLGTPAAWSQEKEKKTPPEKPKTNIEEALAIPRTENSLPGVFPGKVVQVEDQNASTDGIPNAPTVSTMFEKGITGLTGKPLDESFGMFFNTDDIVGIKVNPVGAGLISTNLEVVDAIVAWLEKGGLSRENIIIWDRFGYMLEQAGFTAERYPGIGIEGMQTMDESMWSEDYAGDNSKWLANGHHVSETDFDMDVYYWADVEAPQDEMYLNQHVFNNKYSYFGKLLTKKLTKFINVPVFKNTGNGISMATKNVGYGVVCNTGRLHKPLFFDVCTEVLAFPAVRDKMVLNITDGIHAQYDGGPGPNAEFIYNYNNMFFATDPFAIDRVCHELIVAKRKEMGVSVNEHPRYTDYLRYAEELGLGIGHLDKIEHIYA